MLIGLFDSGVGGLTVLSACKRALPEAEYLYLDDGAHCPYGDKSREEIVAIADRNAGLLFSAGCDAVIIACNTATAAAALLLRIKYKDKIILGLEPAVKPALAATKGKVLLLATPVTADIKKYSDRVIVGVEPNLAKEIEKAYGEPDRLRILAETTLAKYTGFGSVVTGCSHYAHLIPYIPFPVFDGSYGVAKMLSQIVALKQAQISSLI